jgi:hypothetical protein
MGGGSFVRREHLGMIKRRYFVLAVLAGAAAIRFAFSSEAASIVAVLRKRLDYLRLDDAGVHSFARDLAALHRMSSSRLRLVSALGPLYSQVDSAKDSVLVNGIRHGEERIVTTYLLSSDFFSHGQDESRVVNYLGIYDPFRACGNPFARPVG